MSRTRKPARRYSLRPTVDRLEGRALMSFAGALDPTFGAGAVLVPTTGGGGPGFTDLSKVQVESDGSILAAGPIGVTGQGNTGFGLVHLNSNGTTDTSFGTAGEANVIPPSGLVPYRNPSALLVSSGGQIILVGQVQASGGTGPIETLVARLDANGSPDTTFGTNGVTLLDPTTLSAPGLLLDLAVLDTSGHLVLAGNSLNNSATPSVNQVTAVRLNPAGAVDTTFGTNGVANFSGLPSGSTGATASGLAIQPNGQVVILADVSTASTPNSALIRLNADGSQDTSLSQAGILASTITNEPLNSLIIQPDGKFLIENSQTNDFQPVLARLNADGSLDKTLAYAPSLVFANGFALQPDGKVTLLTGYGVARVTANLTLDASFGQGGVAPVPFPTPPTGGTNTHGLTAEALAVGPDNRVVAAGSNFSSFSEIGVVTPATYLGFARLTATGTSARPGDFTGDGVSDPAIYLPATGSFAIQDLTGQTPGKTVQFGSAGPGNSIPAPGNYYATGQQDIAVYLPQFGLFAVQDPTGNTTGKTVQLGTTGKGNSIPTPGDYYGTGVTDFAVYLPQFGLFAVQDPTGKTAGKTVQLGSAGIGQSIPAPGDYYGTGVTDLAVYLPKIGAFAVQDPTGKTAGQVVPFGMPGLGNSLPMPGDYDGSGRTEFAVYVPSQGAFYYRPAKGGPDVMVQFGTKGPGQTLPMQGDYTGSGKTDLGVYLAAYGAFAYQPPTGVGPIEQFGTPGFGATIPVTTTVLNPFPGTTTPPGAGSGNAVAVPGVLGEADLLDFLPATTAKKPGSGASSAS